MELHHTRRLRRTTSALAAVLGAAALAGIAPDVAAVEGFELTRIAGVDRYQTAASLAEAAFTTGSTTAVLASGEDANFPDALAGSYLAGRFGAGAPILLTSRNDLPAASDAAMDELGVETVYIVGGTAAVSEAVVEDLGDREVVRVAGNDRYETAEKIATLAIEGGDAPGTVAGAKTVIVATGQGFADALAAGPLSFKGSLPIVLTPTASLHPRAKSAIEELEATRAWVMGGTAAVSTPVEDELEAMGLTVVRVAGDDRYATAVAAAGRGRTDLAFSSTAIDLASGERFPDALAAGPASGVANRPLLLTGAAELSDATEDYLVANSGTLTQGRVFGGGAAVSETAVSQAEAAASSGETIGANRIVRIDRTNNEYDYVADGTEEVVTVDYDDGDEFTVDGADASVAGFEQHISVGDTIVVDEDEDEHDLTNVSPSSFTSGTVGNVDLENKQFDIIHSVTGVTLRPNVTWSGTYRVNAGNADEAKFESNINEGDTIEIAGGFNLTNVTVAGVATDVTVTSPPDAVTTSAQFKVDGVFGDDPAAATDGDTTSGDEDDDDRYLADCAPTTSGQSFNVDGNAEATCDDFAADLTEGDAVRYDRIDGVEIFTLTNQEPTAETGTAIGTVDTDGNPAPPPVDDSDIDDGGSFSMVNDDGEEVGVSYGPGGVFEVDGQVSSEEVFEREYSAGDRISYEPDDTEASGSQQRLELTNDDLEGAVADVNETDNDRPDPEGQEVDSANSYDVVEDGVVLENVVYDREGDIDEWYVNGDEVSLACFELALENGKTISRAGGDTPYADDTVWEHDVRDTTPPDCVDD